MNRRLALGALLLLATVALWWIARPPSTAPRVEPPAPTAMPPHDTVPPAAPPAEKPVTASPSAVTSTPTRPGISLSAPPAAQSVTTTPPLPTPAPAADPSFVETLAADLDEVQTLFRDFRTALRENPVGTNAEITRALRGDNLKQIKLGVPDGSSLNAEGELVDRWGTPYFFHQLSAQRMEIRSAGPDRQLWTGDDGVNGAAEAPPPAP